MKAKKTIGIICALALALGAVGCNKEKGGEVSDTGEAKYTASYPIETDKTLKLWGVSTHQDYNDPREQPFYKELMKRTGVNLDITVVPGSQSDELFNLMIVSNDLPDIVSAYWTWKLGGPDQCIAEGIVLPLNEMIEKYSPNLKKYLNENPNIDRMVKSDGGNYYMYPFIRDSDYLTTYIGPVVRGDIMDELGLSDPETPEEWEAVLRAFKAAGIESPFNPGSNIQFMAGGFGTWGNYYLRDGKVVYGPVEDAYKEFLTTMTRWYSEGLMEKDLASIDNNILAAKMSSGKSALAFGTGGQLGQWLSAGQGSNPGYTLRALKYATPEKGSQAEFGFKESLIGGSGCAITQQCSDPELAARFLDYGYGEEGHMLSNFGIEGESYTIEDGEPIFTQAMYEYKNGDLGSSISRYAWSVGSGACIQDYRMYKQRMQTDTQKQAIDTWLDTNMTAHLIPPTIPLEEEADRLAQLDNAINTYWSEMVYKFIFGRESLDNFDAYVAEMKRLGLDEAIAFRQKALDRYNAR